MSKKTVAVVFGGKSVEHEVSITTTRQILPAINKIFPKAVLIYVDKDGNWWTGKRLKNLLNLTRNTSLKTYRLHRCYLYEGDLVTKGLIGNKTEKIDLVFPLIHGTYGEDGTLQGLLEMNLLPYVGCDVKASSLGMDKIIQKSVFEKEKIPVLPYTWFWVSNWRDDKKSVTTRVEKQIGYPLCVKPSSLGSSVGVGIARNKKEFLRLVEVASCLDRRVLVERALLDMREINCSAKGYEDKIDTSVCEEPLRSDKILSYNDKYLRGGKAEGMKGLTRLIPAPISSSLTKKVQEYSRRAFAAVGAAGVSRIDFLLDNSSKRLYINEINTIPGSLSYYLWEKSGISVAQLVGGLAEIAIKRGKALRQTIFSYVPGNDRV